MLLPATYGRCNSVFTRLAASRVGFRHRGGARQTGGFNSRLLGGIVLNLTHHCRLTNL